MTTTSQGNLEAPGPGPWFINTSHYAQPATPLYAESFCDPFVEGWEEALHRYGTIMAKVELRFVNHFAYMQIPPALPPPDSNGHPRWKSFEELEAIPWSNNGRDGVAYRAAAIHPAAQARAA